MLIKTDFWRGRVQERHQERDKEKEMEPAPEENLRLTPRELGRGHL